MRLSSGLCHAIPLLLVMSTPALAARDETTSVAQAEDGYTRAVAGPDILVLDKSLSKDLIYTHASGEVQDKAHYLKTARDSGFPVHSARIIERQIQVYGKIGITQGVIGYDVGKGENPARYMAVYRKEGGRWLLLRWQNTRMPSAVR